MAKAGTIREARSNVVTVARNVNTEAKTGSISDATLAALDAGIKLLDERSAASAASRKAEKAEA